MTKTIKSSGRKNKPTKQYKQSMKDFLLAHGVSPSDAHKASHLDNNNATSEEISSSIKQILKGEK